MEHTAQGLITIIAIIIMAVEAITDKILKLLSKYRKEL